MGEAIGTKLLGFHLHWLHSENSPLPKWQFTEATLIAIIRRKMGVDIHLNKWINKIMCSDENLRKPPYFHSLWGGRRSLDVWQMAVEGKSKQQEAFASFVSLQDFPATVWRSAFHCNCKHVPCKSAAPGSPFLGDFQTFLLSFLIIFHIPSFHPSLLPFCLFPTSLLPLYWLTNARGHGQSAGAPLWPLTAFSSDPSPWKDMPLFATAIKDFSACSKSARYTKDSGKIL